jgi:cell division protein FtsZ
MTINLKVPDIRELKPRITVFGVGGAGGNAVNNMIELGLQGCEFVVGNTDAQALTSTKAHRVIQMGIQVTEGLGAGSQPEVGRAAAEEVIDEIRDQLAGAHMVFVTAGMGGGTGTGAAPIVARAARELGILTVGVVTKPFHFEGTRRMRLAESGISELQKSVDTLIVIPNQNLFRVANEQTTFADAFSMADRVLYSGVACITDLMVKEGLINLDFADVRAVMREMGKAMMGTGEASGEKRALRAAEAAIANPLLDDVSMRGARGLLISITGGADLTLYEVDEAATRIREEVDQEANVIFGATRDDSLEGIVRVSVVATGIDHAEMMREKGLAQIDATARYQAGLQEQARLAEIEQAQRASAAAAVAAATRQQAPSMAPQPAYAEQAQRPALALRANPVAQTPAYTVQEQAPAAYQPQQPAMAPAYQPQQQAYAPSRAAEQPAAYAMPQAAAPSPSYGAPTSFIPPQPEQPVRAPRMPRIEDLPLVAQQSLAASRGLTQPEPAPERKRASLIDRLAAAGFGRKADKPVEQAAPAPQPAAAPAPQASGMGAPMAPQDFAKRPALQPQPQNQSRAFEDDQLEIPAFLRRQSQ